jgi:hypothetical protein
MMTAMAKKIPTPGSLRRLVIIKTKEINATETMDNQSGESIGMIIAVRNSTKNLVIPSVPPEVVGDLFPFH